MLERDVVSEVQGLDQRSGKESPEEIAPRICKVGAMPCGFLKLMCSCTALVDSLFLKIAVTDFTGYFLRKS